MFHPLDSSITLLDVTLSNVDNETGGGRLIWADVNVECRDDLLIATKSVSVVRRHYKLYAPSTVNVVR